MQTAVISSNSKDRNKERERGGHPSEAMRKESKSRPDSVPAYSDNGNSTSSTSSRRSCGIDSNNSSSGSVGGYLAQRDRGKGRDRDRDRDRDADNTGSRSSSGISGSGSALGITGINTDDIASKLDI